jgi:t-SNARE complex subunit (syntaxin)
MQSNLEDEFDRCLLSINNALQGPESERQSLVFKSLLLTAVNSMSFCDSVEDSKRLFYIFNNLLGENSSAKQIKRPLSTKAPSYAALIKESLDGSLTEARGLKQDIFKLEQKLSSQMDSLHQIFKQMDLSLMHSQQKAQEQLQLLDSAGQHFDNTDKALTRCLTIPVIVLAVLLTLVCVVFVVVVIVYSTSARC